MGERQNKRKQGGPDGGPAHKKSRVSFYVSPPTQQDAVTGSQVKEFELRLFAVVKRVVIREDGRRRISWPRLQASLN